MKPLEEVTCCIVDAGTFVPIARAMARSVAQCFYYSPWEQEFVGLERCCVGDGLPDIERQDDILDPDFLKKVDLWLFPDIGYGGLQRHLRHDLGKLVWGSMGASDLELYRTRFLDVVKKVGLEVVPHVKIRGLTKLANHLKEVENKWVKINRYRDNMETWHHIDWDHSQRELERLALMFGPLKECVVFVVVDAIDGDDENPVLEIGYDGWTVNGEFPESSFQGYEKKNQLYLGSLLPYEQMPEQVREVNKRFAPVLADYGYCNFWATEIRVKGDKFYFIDPTARMAGQTMEHLLHTCTNLPDVIYGGAAGELVVPEFGAEIAAEATLHYTGSNGGGEEWKTFKVPEEAEPWTALYRFCKYDGAYHFPPHKSDELGVVSGVGDTVQEAIESLHEHFALFDGEPVSIEDAGFVDLIEQIEDAQDEGVEFTDGKLPEPAEVIS